MPAKNYLAGDIQLVNFKVDKKLWNAFKGVAMARATSASAMIREMMIEEVRNNAKFK